MAKTDLTAERLRELLHYDPDSGVFTRERNSHQGRWKAGAEAGCPNRDGYIVLRVNGHLQYAHRLAWLYMHGSWPQLHIDHINGDKSDNRIANLRDVPRCVNLQNMRRATMASQSGLLGAHVRADRGSYSARIYVNGRTRFLGDFKTPEEAHAAYLAAKRERHAGCTI
jgi:hypothetical protein